MLPKTLRHQLVKAAILPAAILAFAVSPAFCGQGAGEPAVNLAPVSLTFSPQILGTTSGAQSVILTNTGNATLTITSVGTSTSFGETNNCGTSVAAGTSCTISVTFSPTVIGTLAGTLTITDNNNGVTGSTQTVSLSGTGINPGASLSAASEALGSQVINTTSAAKTLTLTSNGTTSLSLTSIAIAGTNANDFNETNNCPATLAVAAKCTITLTYTPSVLGAETATLTVADNASSSPQTVALTGTGVVPADLSVTSLAFGNVGENSPSAGKNVTIYNNEAVALSISSITTGNADFTETNTCNGSVPAKGHCVITVTFTPSTLTAETGTLSVNDTAPNSPQTAALTGTGILPAKFSLTSLAFGSVPQSTASAVKTITFYNEEAEGLTISSITTGNPDFTETNTCGGSVPAAGNCVITVTFTPSMMGAETGTLTVTDAASNSPQTAALTGTGIAQATVSPTSEVFAAQTVGTTSAAKTLTLTNNLSTALTISGFTVTGADPSDFVQTNTCGSSLAAGAKCTISVTFTPCAGGSRAASLTITDTATSSPQTVSLSGTGNGSAASLSPASLAFGNQSVSTTSTAQTLTLTNTGNAALSITSLTMTGTNAGDFAQTNTCGSSVAAGANCTISVSFTPSASGARSATLSIADNASGSPQTVSLSGTGTAAAASLSPASLAFGNQSVGTTSTAQTLTLTNTGNAALSITSLTMTGTNAGDFAQTNTCGSSVGAGANCTISVTFTPSASGSRSATLSIADNASGSPQSVSLSGTGTAAGASLSPASLAFGNQSVGTTSTAQALTLTNTGNAALSITSLTMTGTNAGDFAQTNTCGSSVAAGANCTISVSFTPSASGARSAALSIADNASGSPQTVSLTGTGTAAVASLSPTSLSFGSQSVDVMSLSQVITLNNTGSTTLSIASISFTGADAADFTESDTCGSPVAAGGNCTIAILFTPAAAGARTASLSIADNASGSPQSASLSGTGTHDVMLTWSASSGSGVTGYNVYRGTTSGGESSTPLNSIPVAATNYVDTNVTAGATYYYTVAAVGSSGVIPGVVSNEASATVPTP
jgi:hypothetical protein